MIRPHHWPRIKFLFSGGQEFQRLSWFSNNLSGADYKTHLQTPAETEGTLDLSSQGWSSAAFGRFRSAGQWPARSAETSGPARVSTSALQTPRLTYEALCWTSLGNTGPRCAGPQQGKRNSQARRHELDKGSRGASRPKDTLITGQGSLACCSPWGRRVGHNLLTQQQQQ